jgi:hypothetical protein
LRHRLWLEAGALLTLGLPAASGLLPATPAAAQGQIFRIETGEFWLNLHHFLYVLGRHEAGERDAQREAVVGAPADEARGIARLNQVEQDRWRRAVQWYARGLSRRDPVFDPRLPVLVGAFAEADEAPSLAGISLDSAVARVLTDATPLYRKAWWSDHRAANEKWLANIEPLVHRHGQTLLAFVTGAYGMEWLRGGLPDPRLILCQLGGRLLDERESPGHRQPVRRRAGQLWAGNTLS